MLTNSKEEAERFHTNLSKQMSNVKQVKEELEHIRFPYTLQQILDLYCKACQYEYLTKYLKSIEPKDEHTRT